MILSLVDAGIISKPLNEEVVTNSICDSEGDTLIFERTESVDLTKGIWAAFRETRDVKKDFGKYLTDSGLEIERLRDSCAKKISSEMYKELVEYKFYTVPCHL